MARELEIGEYAYLREPVKGYRRVEMTAHYDGYVDVIAENEEDAEYVAKRRLTNPSGVFRDWSRSMFRTEKVERIYK